MVVSPTEKLSLRKRTPCEPQQQNKPPACCNRTWSRLPQVLNMREAPPQIGIVYDSDYAYRAITGTKPINKNGALVGVARVLYHRVQWRTKVNWAWCKGHSGHPANERADKLATLAMRQKGMWRFRFIPPEGIGQGGGAHTSDLGALGGQRSTV